MRKILSYMTYVAMASALAGCGGSSGPSGGDGGSLQTGVFIDAQVTGLRYFCGDLSGYTDEDGMFSCNANDTVTFCVGAVCFPEVAIPEDLTSITPYDYGVPENIARFLQSIDNDANPNNGINVTLAGLALAGADVSSGVFGLDQASFEAAIASAVATAQADNALAGCGGCETGLIDPTDAMNNLLLGTDTVLELADVQGKIFGFYDETGTFARIHFDSPDVGADRAALLFEGDTVEANWAYTVSNNVLRFYAPGEEIAISKLGESFDQLATEYETTNGNAIIIDEGLAFFVKPQPMPSFPFTVTFDDSQSPQYLTFTMDGATGLNVESEQGLLADFGVQEGVFQNELQLSFSMSGGSVTYVMLKESAGPGLVVTLVNGSIQSIRAAFIE